MRNLTAIRDLVFIKKDYTITLILTRRSKHFRKHRKSQRQSTRRTRAAMTGLRRRQRLSFLNEQILIRSEARNKIAANQSLAGSRRRIEIAQHWLIFCDLGRKILAEAENRRFVRHYLLPKKMTQNSDTIFLLIKTTPWCQLAKAT